MYCPVFDLPVVRTALFCAPVAIGGLVRRPPALRATPAFPHYCHPKGLLPSTSRCVGIDSNGTCVVASVTNSSRNGAELKMFFALRALVLEHVRWLSELQLKAGDGAEHAPRPSPNSILCSS